jgi:hypothetical protein
LPIKHRSVLLALVPVALVLAGCGGGATRDSAAGDKNLSNVAYVSPAAIRSTKPGKNMDTNPSNLASAAVTHAFGQLPQYIDDARFRLLPYDVYRVFEPGRTRTRTVRLTTPRTSLVLDTVMVSGPTGTQALQSARAYTVAVTLDGRVVPRIGRYWLYYRNNGPQICRIYFPGDLGSLHMAVQSLVFQPPTPGVHRIRVSVVRRSRSGAPARLVYRYLVHVLPRGPSAAERAIAPEEDGPKPPSRTPLTFLAQS